MNFWTLIYQKSVDIDYGPCHCPNTHGIIVGKKMRTKALILTAALGAAGVTASLAQDPVYSVNAVGYINLDLPAGFALIANQLNNGGNTLDEVITGVATGTTFSQYDGSTFVESLFIEGFGWDNKTVTLAPGQAGYINSAAAQQVTLVGEVPQGELTVQVPAGLSMASSVVPQSASLVDLGFPASTGDSITFMRNGAFTESLFIEGLGYTPDAVPAVGEGFWVNKGAAATWTRNFSVNE
jgi:hypothetical protein